MRLLNLSLMVILFSSGAYAEVQFPAKGRIFAGGVSASPTALNTEMTSQGIKEFNLFTKYGVDITYALAKMLDVGLRYERVDQNNLEKTKTVGQDYAGHLVQDAVLGVARVPLVHSNIVRLETFVAGGAASTTFSLKNATQDGELSKKGYTSPVAMAGASLGVGYKNYFFFFEGGYESNKVSGLKATGTINSSLDSIDLSGPYLAVGLLFDGITATKK